MRISNSLWKWTSQTLFLS